MEHLSPYPLVALLVEHKWRTSPPLGLSAPKQLSTAAAVFRLPSTVTGHPFTNAKNSRFKCSTGQTRFFTKLWRFIKEKAKSDGEMIFSGFSKTRDNLVVIDELFLLWNLSDTDRLLDELEEVSISKTTLLVGT